MDVEVQINEMKTTNDLDNDDVFLNSFKSLKFEEQLRLAAGREGAAAEKRLFTNCIWPIDYGSLKIDESEGYYIVRNATETNRLLLAADVFQDFLSFYADKVQDLTLGPTLDIRLFGNLTSLECTLRHKRIEEFLTNEMVKNLIHLESLQLKELDMECGAASIDSTFLENLLHMKNLKHLQLDYFFATKIKYHQFCKLIYGLPVEILEGNLELEPVSDNTVVECATTIYPNKLKILQICTMFDPSKWQNNFSNFREIFKNLKTLSLKFTDEQTDIALATLASTCPYLEKLVISGTIFNEIKSFSVPARVSEFHLKWCRGITHTNLKQILTKTHIREFISICTKYEGNFVNFPISASIQTLKIDRVEMCDFQGAYENNVNLRNLSWFHTRNCGGNNERKLPELPQAACLDYEDFEMEPKNQMGLVAGSGLATCHNLESLDMGYKCQLTLDTLMQLKNLRQLSTWIMDSTAQQWFYIRALLKLASLQQLTISFARTTNDVPLRGIATNVLALKVVDFNFCEAGLEFFLDLFSQNPQLKLSFSLPPLAFVKPLRSLINHKKFPTFLRTIEIYGYTIDCDELKQNLYATMKKFKFVRNVFDDNPKDCVILYRKRT